MKHINALVLTSLLAVEVSAALLVSDSFTYPDGVLTNVSSGKWRHASGGIDEVNVTAGSVELTRSETGDVDVPLGTTFAGSSAATLYARFTIKVLALPGGANGNYFAHFAGASSRARIFVTTNGAAAGRFRIGIANGSTTASALWPNDLQTNLTYTVVARHSISNAQASLWIDATSPFTAPTVANDTASAASATAFALRQDGGMGTLLVDDLVIATSFAEALAGNETPTVSSIAEQRGIEGTATTVEFQVGDRESAPEALSVAAEFTDTPLIQSVSFSGTGSNRSLTITPFANQTGSAGITLLVSDGVTTNRQTFSFIVVTALLLAEPFEYPDGSLNTNGLWTHHSGSVTGQLQVASGRAVLSTAQTEDVSVPLTGGPFTTNSGVNVFVSFRVNFASLPGSSGDYFAHFNTTGARGRVFASTANAPARRFRIGVANASNDAAEQFPQDLATNEIHQVVVRYDVGTGATTLWLNPQSMSSPSVTAADAVTPTAISMFALRQATGIGTFWLDDLRIGLSFESVVSAAPTAERPMLRWQASGGTLFLSWPVEPTGFVLESNNTVGPGGWLPVLSVPTITNSEHVLTLPLGDGSSFFRLRR
jgi:hypothetical protein